MQLLLPNAQAATLINESVTGQSFAKAVQVRTLVLPANPWDIQLNTPALAAVSKGDVIAGEIWLRRPSPGEPLAELVFERASSPYNQSFSRVLSPTGTNWARFRFAFLADNNYSAGAAQFNLRLGYAVQEIDLGGLTLANYGTSRPLSSFSNDVTYIGRDPEAAWRTFAQARIEQYRKADLNLLVTDQDGFPLRRAAVEVRMKRHAFGFGSAIDAGTLLGTGSDNARYRGITTNWFNKAVLENDLKWIQWEGNPNLAKSALAWFAQRHIPVRGHNLIWPGTNASYYLPADVLTLLGDTNRLRLRIDSHFTNILNAVRGQCVEWDVINEATHLTTIRNILGDGEMVHWFQVAHALDPSALLFFNEYENLETPLGDAAPRDKLYNIVRYLQTNGAPIQGTGLQSHFGGYLTPPEDLMNYLNHFAELGTVLEATEFDVNVADEALQADYLRDFMTVCFSHPAMNGVVMWGFWEKRHWLPAAALIRADWSLKPNGIAWTNLVFGQWWTATNAVSDTNGLYHLRGFKGDYSVAAGTPGFAATNEVSLLNPATNTLTLTLPPPAIHTVQGDSQIRLSWDGTRTGFQLLKSASLSPALWVPANPPSDDGTNWVVLEQLGDKTAYYQLRRGL